jgi:hypothetical protein
MAAVASYGRAARAIITRAIDDLAPEAAGDDDGGSELLVPGDTK